jgi:hypothetical protein
MPNKSKRRWLDVQIILASIAVTSTVAVWNVLARGSRPADNPVSPPPPQPEFTFTYTPTPAAAATAAVDPNAPVRLPQVHLLLGGKMPAPVVVVAAATGPDTGNQASGSKNNGGGGSTGGGGGSTNPPPPAANTGSSRP